MTDYPMPVRTRKDRRSPSRRKGAARYDEELIRAQLTSYTGSSTVTDICAHLSVTTATYYAWYKKHPEFRDQVRAIRDRVDDAVESALLKRALGFEFEETSETNETGGVDGAKSRITRKTVYVAPDVGAAKHWLAMRRPDDWREVKKIEITGAWAEQLVKAAKMLDLDPEEYTDVTEDDR